MDSEISPSGIRNSRRDMRCTALAAISEHLEKHGAKDWHNLRIRFADIPERTWWGWVGKAKKNILKSQPQGCVPARHFSPLSEFTEAGYQEYRLLQTRRMDFVGAMREQMDDIELLRSQAMTSDGKIKNFALFIQALSLRERSMATFAKSIVPLTDSMANEDFLEAAAKALKSIDKDVAIRVLRELQKLDSSSTAPQACASR